MPGTYTPLSDEELERRYSERMQELGILATEAEAPKQAAQFKECLLYPDIHADVEEDCPQRPRVRQFFAHEFLSHAILPTEQEFGACRQLDDARLALFEFSPTSWERATNLVKEVRAKHSASNLQPSPSPKPRQRHALGRRGVARHEAAHAWACCRFRGLELTRVYADEFGGKCEFDELAGARKNDVILMSLAAAAAQFDETDRRWSYGTAQDFEDACRVAGIEITDSAKVALRDDRLWSQFESARELLAAESSLVKLIENRIAAARGSWVSGDEIRKVVSEWCEEQNIGRGTMSNPRIPEFIG